MQEDAGGPNRPTPLDGFIPDDALHAQLYEGIDLRKSIRGERIHDSFQGVQRSASEQADKEARRPWQVRPLYPNWLDNFLMLLG